MAAFGYNFTLLKIAWYSWIHSIRVSKNGGHKFEGKCGEPCGKDWREEMEGRNVSSYNLK